MSNIIHATKHVIQQLINTLELKNIYLFDRDSSKELFITHSQIGIIEAASPQQPSTVKIKNTPDLGSLNIPATAPCVVGYGAGVVAPGIGVNFGGAYTDDDCGSRETARSFVGMGDIQSAVEVLCASKYAAVAKVCKNLKAEESR